MTDFCGHPTASLLNDKIRLEYLTDVGPRIARIFFGDNPASLLAELPHKNIDSNYGRFAFMGGHRLWHAPEALPRSYVPDQPVECQVSGGSLHLAAATEPPTGIAKSMTIKVAADEPVITVQHGLLNNGSQAVHCAPWALSMCRQGGTVILPQPQQDHPDSPLLPNRWLALWPYTRVNDPRLQLADDFILLQAQPHLPPLKVGGYNTAGWLAYWTDRILWVKRFSVGRVETYPDNGCNVESYCDDQFVELETLGPLVRLNPGEAVNYQETWEFYGNLEQDFIPENLRQRLMAH